MKFKGHDTFYIRDGWLTKGMKYIDKDGRVFSGSLGNPMDVFGIGSNMVKALKYWLLTTKLVKDTKNGLEFTDFGRLVFENDKYIEEIGTLYLIHYMICTNIDNATAWYFMFNEFKLNEFDKEDFLRHINIFVESRGESVSIRSLEDDITCIANTYISKNTDSLDPESNMFCPLNSLGLLEYNNIKKTYRKKYSNSNIPSQVALAVILDNAQGAKEIKISSIKGDNCNLGKAFNLDTIAIMNILSELENKGYISIVRTAGLDIIRIRTEMNFNECILNYYNSLV